jgi:sirohydrochlorin ferrochelatase
MEAILLLGHGSRAPEAGRDMERVAAGLKQKYGYAFVEVCYMSLQEPGVPEVVARCVGKGATRLTVIPYFLHMGQHIREDIPEIFRAEKRKFPDVTIILGPNLGYDEALVDLVRKRVGEAASTKELQL